MSFDLRVIQAELEGRMLASPWPAEVGTAVVCDVQRDAGEAPIAEAVWQSLGRHAGWGARLGLLGWLIASSPTLRAASVAAMSRSQWGDRAARLASMVEATAPLTPELVRKSRFRQEELLRRWVEVCAGRVAGETEAESARVLERLDYRRALAEMDAMEQRRKAEEAERQRLLAEAEARRREAEARGGYE